MSASKTNLRATRAVRACNDQDPLDRHDSNSQSGKKLDSLKDEGQERWGIGGQKCDKSDKPKSVVCTFCLVFFWAVGSSRLVVETLARTKNNTLSLKDLLAFMEYIPIMIMLFRAAKYRWRNAYDQSALCIPPRWIIVYITMSQYSKLDRVVFY